MTESPEKAQLRTKEPLPSVDTPDDEYHRLKASAAKDIKEGTFPTSNLFIIEISDDYIIS